MVKHKAMWFLPRSGSTSFIRFLSKKHGIKNNEELFGPWNDEQTIHEKLKEQSVFKIQPEQFNLRKNIALPIIDKAEVLVMAPRNLVDSYTSFIISYANAKRNHFKNSKQYWIPPNKEFKTQFGQVNRQDAIYALDFYSNIVEEWIDNFKYFNHGKLASVNSLPQNPVWSLEEKIQLIEDWNNIEIMIYKKGMQQWSTINEMIKTLDVYV